MRFPHPTLPRLMSGRSAIVEEGDGEMTIPPVLQPVISIFSPVLNLNIVPALAADTWFLSNVLQGTGVTAAQLTNFPTMPSGRWDLDVTLSMAMVGNTNINSTSALQLFDPVGGVQAIFQFGYLGAIGGPLAQSRTMTLPFLFSTGGWFLRHATSALIAGDSMLSQATVYARRIF